MPTYQYACTQCGERLEVVQSFSDDPLTECPACHGRLRKVFAPVGVVFKGSGFYKTDSRTSSKPAGASTSTADTSTTTEAAPDKGGASTSSTGPTGDPGSTGSTGSTGASSTPSSGTTPKGGGEKVA
jgi:putative FmdB family regulatory protein